MKIGTYAAPLVLFVFFSTRAEKTRSVLVDIKLMSVLFLVAYIIHQFEEHWVDLLGEQYAFYSDVNQLILSALNAQDSTIIPLSPEAIYVINTSLVWLVGILAIWRSPKHLFPSLAMAGITLVNGISHIILGIAQQAYNPGLLTATVIFVPLAVAFYRTVLTTFLEAEKQVIVSIIWSVLAHIIMVAGLLAANWFNVIPEVVYFALLIVWSVIPILLFNASIFSVPQVWESTMEIERSGAKALTAKEIQHLEALKAVVETALTDGVLSDGEIAHIKSIIWADGKVTYEELRIFHETMQSLMGDELPAIDWRPN
ncbi:MAG: HXXEE domain-containing protein [Cyanobacteria bacterium P01_H01_bin.58]